MSEIVYIFGGQPYINLTNRCTNSCTFCLRDKGHSNDTNNIDSKYNNTSSVSNIRNHNTSHNDSNSSGIGKSSLWLKSEPTATQVVDELQKLDLNNFESLTFCGYGEPTYCLETLKNVAKFAKNQGMKTRLNTNGQGNLINKKNIATDLQGLIDCVSISLNAADKDEYQRLCRPIYGQISYDEIWNFALECHNVGIHVVMSVVDVIPTASIERAQEKTLECGYGFKVRAFIEKAEDETETRLIN